MLKNEPKKLIAHDLNFKNTGAQVYQIKVLKQWKDDCWTHSFRNGLYIMDLVLSPRDSKTFNAIYANMIDRKRYEAFTKGDTCPKLGTVTREFIKTQLDCMPDCMPAQSLEYVKRALTFAYEPSFDQNKLQEAANKLTALEKSQPSPQAIFDYVLISQRFNLQQKNLERLIELFHGLRNNNDYCCTINFASDAIDHEFTLVMHKKNGALEYLFADANNISFKGDNFMEQKGGGVTVYYVMEQNEYNKWITTFSSAINQTIHWVENPEQVDAAVVRVLYKFFINDYYRQKEYNIKESGIENWQRIQDFAVEYLEKFYTVLQRYNLLNNPTYTNIYKKIYCETIKKEQKEQKPSKHYTNLLSKVGC